MGIFSENIVNQRFKQVFEELEKNNLIKGKSDIAKQLGTYNHVVNSILKGDRNITVEQLHKLFEIYAIDANYLFGFANQMFKRVPDSAIPVRYLDERQSTATIGFRCAMTRVGSPVGLGDQKRRSKLTK